jgi:hypothetical protein
MDYKIIEMNEKGSINKVSGWRDLGIIVLGLIVSGTVFILMINLLKRYAIEVGGEYFIMGISIITTSILTVWLIIANLLLVLKTHDYVKLTRKMVDETKKQTRISEMALIEQYKLKKQKKKILKILVELPVQHILLPEELAILTGIDIDLILDPIIAMMEDGLIKIDDFGNYVLKRGN